jgi:NhaP-type Na+/H+ or K+/H+ antiporter
LLSQIQFLLVLNKLMFLQFLINYIIFCYYGIEIDQLIIHNIMNSKKMMQRILKR